MKTPYFYIPMLSETYRLIRRRLMLFFFAGEKIYCPACEKSFRAFIGNQLNKTCPYCRSETRHRLLCLLLNKTVENNISNKQLSVLYFAPDFSVKTWLSKRSCFSVTTTDLSAPDVDVNMDITNLVFESETFDLIICSHVLEHIPDDASAIRNLYSVLKPGGSLIVQVPYKRNEHKTDEDISITDPYERVRRFGQFDHVRVYGVDICQRLALPGFDVDVINLMPQLDKTEAERMELWDDTIFVCRKG